MRKIVTALIAARVSRQRQWRHRAPRKRGGRWRLHGGAGFGGGWRAALALAVGVAVPALAAVGAAWRLVSRLGHRGRVAPAQSSRVLASPYGYGGYSPYAMASRPVMATATRPITVAAAVAISRKCGAVRSALGPDLPVRSFDQQVCY